MHNHECPSYIPERNSIMLNAMFFSFYLSPHVITNNTHLWHVSVLFYLYFSSHVITDNNHPWQAGVSPQHRSSTTTVVSQVPTQTLWKSKSPRFRFDTTLLTANFVIKRNSTTHSNPNTNLWKLWWWWWC